MSLTLLLSAGNALVKCGQAQLRIGNAEREFIQTTSNNFLQPLHNFLEGDMKTIQVSRGLGGGGTCLVTSTYLTVFTQTDDSVVLSISLCINFQGFNENKPKAMYRYVLKKTLWDFSCFKNFFKWLLLKILLNKCLALRLLYPWWHFFYDGTLLCQTIWCLTS